MKFNKRRNLSDAGKKRKFKGNNNFVHNQWMKKNGKRNNNQNYNRSTNGSHQRITNGHKLYDITNGNSSTDFYNFHNKSNGKNDSQNTYNENISLGAFSAHKKSLPIFDFRRALLSNLVKFETNIVVGDTGSGKSTQIPQYLYQEGLHKEGKICVTQPRKLATINLANRVAEELECHLGSIVGYAVRFEEKLSGSTCIKFVTDGMLLREALLDPLLKKYKWIILDEAHERTVNTDILFGIVKKAQRIRKKRNKKLLKIIVMSATMDVDPFVDFFNTGNSKTKVNVLMGRQHEVSFVFPIDPPKSYFLTLLTFVIRIHLSAPIDEGILVFLTGQEEIGVFVDRIKSFKDDSELQGAPEIKAFPLYAQLPDHQQQKIFAPVLSNARKIIVSTNVAETSLTIPGISFVIDSCCVKTRTFDRDTGFHKLEVCKISQAQAIQRAGRAGRERPGTYYSAISKEDFESLDVNPEPEILKADLTATYLTLLGAKVKNPLTFNFVDKPLQKSFLSAEKELRDLGIITGLLGDVALTELGKQMNYLPLKPSYAKILLHSSLLGCTHEILTIISLLSCESIYVNPSGKVDEAHQKRRRFRAVEGDHFSLLNVYNAFIGCTNPKPWCNKNFLNFRNLDYASKIRSQLVSICENKGIAITSCEIRKDPYEVKREPILKSLISGLFKNVAKKFEGYKYKCLLSLEELFIHPGSYLYRTPAQFVLFTDVSTTGKRYMTINSKIDPLWLKEICPDHFCNIDLPKLENIYSEVCF